MDRLEFYKELYYRELDRREVLEQRLTIPFTILSLLLGASSYFLENLSRIPLKLNWGFYGCFLALLSAIGFSVWFIFKAYYGYSYSHMPNADKIEEHRTDLDAYYTEYQEAEGNLEDAFESFLVNSCVEAASINATHNDKKSSYIHRAKGSLFLAIIAAFICFALLNAEDINSHVKTMFNSESREEVVSVDEEEGAVETGSNTSTTTASASSTE